MFRYFHLFLVTYVLASCNPTFSDLDDCYSDTDCSSGLSCDRSLNVCILPTIEPDASVELDSSGEFDAATADASSESDTSIGPDASIVPDAAVQIDASIQDASQPDSSDDVGTADTGVIAASCTDGLRNQNELGVDCGGVCASCLNTLTAATTLMGCNLLNPLCCGQDEIPPHLVTISEFMIDQNEVTVEAYTACVREGVCRTPISYAEDSQCNWDSPRSPDQPINCVSYLEARTYCEYAGKRNYQQRLNGERAARASEFDIYPWGDLTPNINLAIYNETSNGTTQPTRSTLAAAHGLYDMAGNVWEWVEDCYLQDLYLQRVDIILSDPLHKPQTCPSGHVLRGGSAFDNIDTLRSSFRYGFRPDSETFWTYGIRCAKNARRKADPLPTDPVPVEPLP